MILAANDLLVVRGGGGLALGVDSNGFPPVIFVVLLSVWLSACDSNTAPQSHKFVGQVMGTSYHVKTIGLPRNLDYPQTARLIDDSLREIDQLMSTYKADSEVSKFTKLEPEVWFTVSSDTYSVLRASSELSRLSDGAFDVTIGPVVSLWGFGPVPSINDVVPSKAAIERARERTGYQYLILDPEHLSIKKMKRLEVDLSAIAKGYAVDKLVGVLKRNGVTSGLVEVGGEVMGFGNKPSGAAWRIAIERPVEGVREIDKTISLNGKAVATSGDYRNYFEVNDVRYSHTIDPNSGYPISHHLASVSVVHDSAMYADGWATALMVLGGEKGLRLAEAQGLAAYFIVREGGSFVERRTPLFESYLN